MPDILDVTQGDPFSPEAINLLEKRNLEEMAAHLNSEKEGWYRRAHFDWAQNVGRWPEGQEKPKPKPPLKSGVVTDGTPQPVGWPRLPLWSLVTLEGQLVCEELPDPTVKPSGRQEAIGARMQYIDEYRCMVEDTMEMGHIAIRDGLKLRKKPKFMAPKNVLGEDGGTYEIIGAAA